MHAETQAKPLILAIETDRHRATQLFNALRPRLQAEILIAESARIGIDRLEGRIPALVLTSPFLGPKDDGVIAQWLRGLGAEAGHVQTLAAPLLADSSDTGPARSGRLSSLLRDRLTGPGSEGCDPSVFAEQVDLYLSRTTAERAPLPRVEVRREPDIAPFDAAPERPWDRIDPTQPHVAALLQQLASIHPSRD